MNRTVFEPSGVAGVPDLQGNAVRAVSALCERLGRAESEASSALIVMRGWEAATLMILERYDCLIKMYEAQGRELLEAQKELARLKP